MRKSRGMSFIEIMIALCVLTIAMLPIFQILHKGTEDTDVNSSQAYALTKATEILNTIIDTVPFEVLRGGNPGYFASADICHLDEYSSKGITQDYAQTMVGMLFGTADPDYPSIDVEGKKQFPCVGRVTDMRGITYRIWLCVEDMGDHQAATVQPEEKTVAAGDFSASMNGKADLFFSFLKNPQKVSEVGWSPQDKYNENAVSIYSNRGARCELELSTPDVGVAAMAVPPAGSDVYSEADFTGPTQRRYTSRMICDKANFAKPATPDEIAYSCLKRLIIEVQWNLDRPNFTKPEVTTGNIQRVHLITLKGDVGR